MRIRADRADARESDGGELCQASGKVCCFFMDPMIVQYALFILVALLIIGAVVALNRWLYRHNRPASGGPHTWVKFDVKRPDAREEVLPGSVFDDDEEEEAELHVRAKQNGHHADGPKPLV